MDLAKEQSKSLQNSNNKTTYNELSTACPCCDSYNELSSRFCEECGHSLLLHKKCPKCGVAVHCDADICEACGEWLLKGQCMYCYSTISENETYCGECGNPVEGLICPKCHRLSHFDFCSYCHVPLSRQAKEMAVLKANDPAIEELANLFQEMAGTIQSADTSHSELSPAKFGIIEQQTTDIADELIRMKVYREGLLNKGKETSSLQVKSIFSDNQKERINDLNLDIFQEEERHRLEEERRRQEEERRRQEEERKRREEEERLRQEEALRREEERKLQEQINAIMHKVSKKKFSSNQEARRFFMNMISGLPDEVANKIVSNRLKWRCFAYDCVHSSPSECGDPSKGGVWLLQ